MSELSPSDKMHSENMKYHADRLSNGSRGNIDAMSDALRDSCLLLRSIVETVVVTPSDCTIIHDKLLNDISNTGEERRLDCVNKFKTIDDRFNKLKYESKPWILISKFGMGCVTFLVAVYAVINKL